MTQRSWPRVAVVGAGAVGGFFGGMLARAGAHVTLIGRPQHVDVWSRGGLILESAKYNGRFPVAASTDLSASRDADLVLFSVKSLDTETAARELAPYVRPDASIVSLQNGVDNVERIRAAANLDAIAAVVYVASSMPAPGTVKHGGRGDLIVGDLPGRAARPRDDAIAQVAEWFEAAEVPCRVSPNIEVDLWIKLITNIGLNAISAVAHATYGAIVKNPDSRETVRQLVEECVAVARAGGVALPPTDFVDFVWRFGANFDRVYSSTSQDLERGKPTEIDALNGFVVRRGAQLGVPTPVNQSLFALVKLQERVRAL